MVVLLHADPVLPDFSAAFPDGAPRGSIMVFVHRVRRRMFRALHVAGRLAAKWSVGVRRFRDLSFARVRAGNVARHVAHAFACTRGWVFPSRGGPGSWSDALYCCGATL